MSVRTYEDIPRIYLDMDGVLADFEAAMLSTGKTPSQLKMMPGAYSSLPVIPGAKEGVSHLLKTYNVEIFALTKIPSENAYSAAEKIIWLKREFSVLKDHIIISPDKGCVGNKRDFLVDDFPEWANASSFRGLLIPFGPRHEAKNWKMLLDAFKFEFDLRKV